MVRKWLITTLEQSGYEVVKEYAYDYNVTNNSSPKLIFIKKNKFSIKKHGQLLYRKETKLGENFHRTATWSILEHKTTKKRYFIINTHLTSGSSSEYEIARKKPN